MRKIVTAIWILLFCGVQLGFCQDRLDHVKAKTYIYCGAETSTQATKKSNLKSVIYTFEGLLGDSLRLGQYGENPFVNIARIGASQACICIGDTVLLEMIAIDAQAESAHFEDVASILRWLKPWGKVEQNGTFLLKKRFQRRFVKRCAWLNTLVVSEERVFYVFSSGLKKRYTAHGSVGDRCESCEPIDPNL